MVSQSKKRLKQIIVSCGDLHRLEISLSEFSLVCSSFHTGE